MFSSNNYYDNTYKKTNDQFEDSMTKTRKEYA